MGAAPEGWGLLQRGGGLLQTFWTDTKRGGGGGCSRLFGLILRGVGVGAAPDFLD